MIRSELADEQVDPNWEREERAWAHNLSTAVAAALELFDPPEKLDERLLARTLREVATRSEEPGDSLFLRAVADALDHPKAEHRLSLGKGRRGRPRDDSKVERALTIGALIATLQAKGWKKEAALQEAMTQSGKTRSVVLRAYADYRELRPLLDEVQLAVDTVRKSRSTKS